MKNKISLTLLALAIMTLSGCGFQLRGAAELPSTVSPMAIQGIGTHTPLFTELRQALSDANVKVTGNPDKARSILRLRDHEFQRRVLSVDGSGKVVEYELHHAIDVDLINADGGILVAETPLAAERSYENLETEVLGKKQEEVQLERDMRLDLASRIISLLQAKLR